MLKPVHGLLPIALSLGALTPTTYGADFHQGNAETVFVLSNDSVKNEVLAYQLGYSGQFDFRVRVATGGRGSGGTTDPLQSQGALTLSGAHDLLFAVNSASGTVSTFHLVEGLPVLVDVQPSGGAFPVAVAEHNDMVCVLNADGSGAVEVLKADGPGNFMTLPIQPHSLRDKFRSILHFGQPQPPVACRNRESLQQH